VSDILVTTPKGEMGNAAREAADCIAAGGGRYFRRFGSGYPEWLHEGDRVFYVEDGAIRGFAVVCEILVVVMGLKCDTTGRQWGPGVYYFMQAASWHWIKPIPYAGFQGYRPWKKHLGDTPVEIIGGWRDPRP
jgi:hypothetical protein